MCANETRRAACVDGALHVWNTSKTFARPDRTGESAHEKGLETTGVVFNREGTRLASRGGDDTVKCTSISLIYYQPTSVLRE